MVLATYDGECTVVRFATVVKGTDDAHSHADAPEPPRGPLLADVRWDLSPDAYRAAVEVTRERIRAGDVYVLNLTARLEGGARLRRRRSLSRRWLSVPRRTWRRS